MKKFVALILVVSLLATLGGCTSKSTVDTSGTSETKETQTSADDQPLINTGSLIPITNEKVSMTMGILVGPTNEDPNEMWFFKYFEELTNVHWDFLVIPSSAWGEKKPILMATGEYPDVFFGPSFTAGEIVRYANEGIFVPLNEHIDKHGDMIKHKMEMIQDSWINITCPDGNIYALPALNLGYPFTDNRSWINKKWLDNVGLSVPVTLDDFYNVLTAFKNNDANGNGDANDEIPWSGFQKSNATRMMMLNAFGFATGGDNIALDRNRNAVYVPLTETYIDYLKFMNKCYKEQLLDQDYFSMEDIQFKAKGAEGIIGAAAYAAPFLMDPEGFKNWVAIALVRNASDTPIVYKSSPVSIGRFVVTDKCKYPDVAVRWANLFYDPEYAFYIMYGPEYGTEQDPDGIGTRVVYDENGNFKTIETPGWDPNKMTLWDYYAQNHPVNSNFNFGIDDSYIFSQLFPGRPKNNQDLALYHKKEIDTGEGNLNEAYWRYNNLITAVPYATTGYPTIYLTEEVQEKVDSLKTPLNDCVSRWEAKFITGEASIDNDFKTFLSELESLNAKEFLQIYIDAYKR